MRVESLISRDYGQVDTETGVDSLMGRLQAEGFLVVMEGPEYVGILTPFTVLQTSHRLAIDCIGALPRVDSQEDTAHVLELMKEIQASALPVFRGDEFIGVILWDKIADYYLFQYRKELEEEVARKTAELSKNIRELYASRRSFAAIVETSHDGILVLDANGRVLYCNSSAECLFGKPERSLAGADIGVPLVDGDVTELDIVRLSTNPGVAELRIQATQWNGQEAFLAVLTDITERKQAAVLQEEFIRKLKDANTRLEELDRIKIEFVSTVSHQLRTPITSISAALEVLVAETVAPLNEGQKEFLDSASRNTKRLAQLIEDLLDLSRLDSGNVTIDFTEFSLADMLTGVVGALDEMERAKALDVTIGIPHELPLIVSDKRRVEQIATNLLSNAIKFTPNGGKIHLTAGLTQHNGADCFTFTVSDTGRGMPAAELPKLFERFHRIRDLPTEQIPGTGLGLSICREFVQLLDGTIEVQSEVGRGSAFTVFLPKQRADDTARIYMRHALSTAKRTASAVAYVVIKRLTPQPPLTNGPLVQELCACLRGIVHPREDRVALAMSENAIVLILPGTERDGARALVRRARHSLARMYCRLPDVARGEASPVLGLGVWAYPEQSFGVEEIVRDTASLTERIELKQADKLRPPMVLVVDDDPSLLKAIVRSLAQSGYSVTEATDGAKAMDLIAGRTPDVVVLDLLMPVMDGYTVLERLRDSETTRDIPVIVLSGDQHADPEALIRLGAREFLTKPFSPAVLLDVTKRLVGASGACDAKESSDC